MTLGQQSSYGRGVAVGIAVDEAARPRDRRIDDLGVRHLGPLGARQIDVWQPLQRQRLLAHSPRAPLAVQLLLIEVLELPVVVPEAQGRPANQSPGARLGPGPSITRNQIENKSTATPTLIAKMRSSAPRS